MRAARTRICPLIFVCAAMAVLAGAQAATAPRAVKIPLEQYTLSNGLRVILSPDHSAPTYSIVVTYDVGSRNERPGRTGFAHLFEHMMFEGTPALPKGEIDQLVSSHGGNMNGTTNKDRTMYFETLLSNQLELGPFIEADRMRTLPEALTQAKLDNQRQAVQEERRLSVDNVAYGKTGVAVDELAYDNFNYKHSVIGSMDDLNAATLADVAAFFKTYYAPNNAVVSMVGDFEPAQALASVKKYFGPIPRQPAPAPPDMAQPPQTSERRQTLTDPFARLPRLDLAYRMPAGNTPDWYAMSMLGDILAGGRASRLYQELVQQKQLAVNIFGGASETRGPGLFRLISTPRPGKPMADLEQAIEADLAQVGASGVKPEEMQRVLMQLQTGSIAQLQSTLGRAIQIGTYAVYFHQPELINTMMDHYRAVTAADLQRVARQYFPAANRTVVITLPAAANAAPAPARRKP